MIAQQPLLARVTVKPKRKAVDVLSWGREPLAYVDGNVIPDGFMVRTKMLGELWTVCTRVVDRNTVMYKFSHDDFEGSWEPSTGKAWVKINHLMAHTESQARNFTGKENTRLILGLAYPSMQREVRLRFK